jgi:DNA-binding Lrp family transcriptional regulator
LDRIDKEIIREFLNVSSRTSYRALARKYGLSPNAIKNRVEKLVEQGVILEFQVFLASEVAGYEVLFGLVYTDGTENCEEFIPKVGSSPMVGTVCTLIVPEGGAYFLYGRCMGPSQLAELGGMLRALSEVVKVDLHMAAHRIRGTKIEFSKQQLMVLRFLQQDSRMRVEEIAKRTGTSTKTTRRILKELEAGNGVHYSIRVNPSAGWVDAWVRIEWNDKITSADEIARWLQNEFPDDLYWLHISSSESVMLADFILDNILDLNQISARIRGAPFVKSTASLAASAQSSFEGLKEIKLREVLDEAGV